MNKFLLGILSLMVLGLAGCSTAYYQRHAVGEARDYIFEKMPDMNQENIAFVKYTKPVAENSDYYITDPDMRQTCYVWTPPDMDGVSIVVSGTSRSDMRGWYPVRMLLRKPEVKEEQSQRGGNEGDTLPQPNL